MTDTTTVRTHLEELGLAPTESAVYEYGALYPEPLSVQQIQRHTGLKRPTIYYALEQLTSKGLVSSIQGELRTEFMFQPPQALEQLVQNNVRRERAKLHTVAKLIDLMPTHNAASGTKVSYFEGLQGVKTVIDMTLYCQSKQWLVIAPFKNFLSEYDEQYARYYIYTKRRNEIKTKTLWEAVMPSSRVLSAHEVKEKNPRIMPETMKGRFESIMVIFDEKIAIIGPKSQMSAIVIESSEITSMFRGLFHTIWDVSIPYKTALSALQDRTSTP
jgi:HTH-type transcriptional regulator, sugar sensing transcriptional regulator